MTRDDLSERLRAVERALTDADTAVADLSETAAVQERLDDVESDLETLTERLDALDATVQSLHGYVGELEHVNDRVERRADAARAAVERLDDQPAQRREPDPEHARSTDADAEQTPDADRSGSRPAEPAATDSAVVAADDEHGFVEEFGHESSSSGEPSEQSLLDRVRESL